MAENMDRYAKESEARRVRCSDMQLTAALGLVAWHHLPQTSPLMLRASPQGLDRIRGPTATETDRLIQVLVFIDPGFPLLSDHQFNP